MNEKVIDFMPLAVTVIRLMAEADPIVFEAMVQAGQDPDSATTSLVTTAHSLVYALSAVLTPLLKPLHPAAFEAFAQQMPEHIERLTAQSRRHETPQTHQTPEQMLAMTEEQAAAFRAAMERLYHRPNGNENADESQGS
jgi:hypothetical protein